MSKELHIQSLDQVQLIYNNYSIENVPKDALQKKHYLFFSLGHIFNDLGGSLYFNYLFYFLKRVVQTPAASAVFLAGQVTDGLLTPLLGHFCDKYGSQKIGKRTSWYIAGLIIFTVGYSALYLNINDIWSNPSSQLQYTYYISSNFLTNFGWCAVQIANMSLIPSITYSRTHRSKLNNMRNSRTFMCTMLVLIVGAILFGTVNNDTKIIFWMMTGFGIVGLICSIAYILGVPQKSLQKGACLMKQYLNNKITTLTIKQSTFSQQVNNDIQVRKLQQVSTQSSLQILKSWLASSTFYLFALFYLASRLYINVGGTLLPFLIVDVLQYKQQGAIIPVYITYNSAVITIMQILTTLFILPKLSKLTLKSLSKKYGDSLSLNTVSLLIFIIASFIAFGNGALMLILTPSIRYLIFVFGIVIGITQAVLLNLSIDLMNEVIGKKVKNGGILIGIYGFLDKCMSGLVIYVVTSVSIFDDNLTFKKFAVCLIPTGIFLITGVLGTIKFFKTIRQLTEDDNPVQNLSPRNQSLITQLQQEKLQSQQLSEIIKSIQKDMIF